MDLNESLRAFMLGFIIVIVSVLSRVGGDSLMVPRAGEYISHVVTNVVLICLVLALTYRLVKTLKIKYRNEGFRKVRKDLPFFGLLWLVMILLTDVIQQYFLAGNQADFAWIEYNILRGRLTSLFLLVVAVAPYGFGTVMLRRQRHRSRRR